MYADAARGFNELTARSAELEAKIADYSGRQNELNSDLYDTTAEYDKDVAKMQKFIDLYQKQATGVTTDLALAKTMYE